EVGVGDLEARFREHRPHHQRDHARPDLLVVDLVRVLGGDDELADAHRPAVLVHDADLSLAVGPEPGEVAALADDREPLGDAMGACVSCAMMASWTGSGIWSAILSGWPSVTDSDVKTCRCAGIRRSN